MSSEGAPLKDQAESREPVQPPPAEDRPAPARMKWFTGRRLTEGEVKLARQVFGDSLPYRRIRIVQAPPLWWGAMAPFGKRIYHSRWRAARDFSLADMHEQSWFIHEMTHLWQAQNGVILILAKLGAVGKRAYKIPKGKTFGKMGIEAQAEVARKLFLARAGAPEDHGPSPDELEKLWTEAPKRRKERVVY